MNKMTQDMTRKMMMIKKTLLMVLMMTFGTTVSWGQDYSGKYYIASDAIVNDKSTYDANTPANNYYLCPTEGWCYYKATNSYDADGTAYPNPFLTTYKWRDGDNDNKVIWIIEKCPNSSYSNYYYFKQHIEGNRYKYLMLNGKISGTPNNNNAKNRMRVHLEEHVENTDNPTTNALFSITLASAANVSSKANEKSVIITPKNTENEDSKCKYLVVNGGNANALTGQSAKSDGPGSTNEKYKWTGGIIGLFYDNDNGNQDANAPFYLENKPTISYTNQDKVHITYFDYADNEVEIRYTTNGDIPTASSTLYTGDFDIDDGVTTIKAIAIKDGKESDVSTSIPPFFLGSTHKYLIQSQGNGWTSGSFQGCHYYVIPGDVESGKTKLNTTTMLRPSMQWYFLDAGDNYYYIVNNVGDARMRYNTTNGVHMDTWDDNNANEFKFQIKESATAGTYNIIPYGVTEDNKYLNKASGNTGEGALLLYSNATDANSRWKFVPHNAPLADTPPFIPSGENTSVYYKIQNGNGTAYHIIPPTSSDGNATASNATDDATVRSMSWYFIQVDDPTAADWLAYYKIINAGTGRALYYAYTANNSPCLKVGDYDGSNDDYKFAFVKSPTADYYYIVPKSHKDDQLNSISTFYRDGSNIKPATTRGPGNNVWTFIPADDFFCNDPEFVEEGGVIKIKCSTNAAKIYINTESNADPTIADENLYAPTTNENQNWATTTQIRIKAIAVVSDGASPTPNTASSAVVTLLNKPDVTLTTASYEYDGTAKTFEKSNIAEVSITANEVKTTADASTYDIDAFENNIVAGTPSSATPPTVNLKDIAGDSWYILNASAAFTITPKALTITAASDSKDYDGTALTKNSYTNTALADGDAIESVTITGSQIVVGSSDNVPSTAVIKKGEEDRTACYEITYANGTLTVTKKALTITADSDTKVYDGTALTKNSYTNTDLADGDAIESVTITGSQTVVGGSDNVPSAAVVKKGEEDRTACYEITYTNGTLTVTKKALTITADSDTKVYDGTALTKNSYTNSDLADGDAIESVTVTGSQTIVGSSDNVPSAAVIKKGEENRTACYDITYTNGTLTVTAIGVTVTAENKSKVYSKNPATDPALTATVTGLIGTDEVTYTISRAAGEDVNNYVITPSGESAQGNYTVTYVPGTFTINPAALTITPDDGQSKQYGDPDPELTYTSAGLMEGDALAGALARAEGENANSDGYAITQGTIDDSHNPNYTITFTTGKTFVITPKSLGDDTDPAENITIEITEADADHVVVKQGGKTLREGNEGTNYDYSISAEGDATTKYYKVTITGRNNYEGSFQATFANLNLSKREGSSDAGGAATFVSNSGDGDFAVPDDMVAYIVTGINAVAGTIVVEPLDNIPEQVPVLLISAVNANGFVVTSKNDGTNPTGTNLLQEATGDVAARTFPAADIYLLYKGEFVLNAAGTLPDGKVYLQKPSGETPAPAILSIDWGNVTGIEDVRGKMEEVRSDYWYTLEGVKLSGRPTKRGLYLRDGKKVVVK